MTRQSLRARRLCPMAKAARADRPPETQRQSYDRTVSFARTKHIARLVLPELGTRQPADWRRSNSARLDDTQSRSARRAYEISCPNSASVVHIYDTTQGSGAMLFSVLYSRVVCLSVCLPDCLSEFDSVASDTFGTLPQCCRRRRGCQCRAQASRAAKPVETAQRCAPRHG